MKVVTVQEMRDVEALASTVGLSTSALIVRAGTAVAETVAGIGPDGPIVVLAGPGNNGADGVAAAEHLRAAGRAVTVLTFNRSDISPFLGQARCADDALITGDLEQLVGDATVIIDAVLGVGQNRAPDETLSAILRTVNAARSSDAIGLAVDIPTGVQADSGEVWESAFRADVTLCLGYIKRGAILAAGAQHAGAVFVADLGIPPDMAQNVSVETFDDAEISALLPMRAAAGNKGTSGRLLFVGGSRDFVGAPVLASMAAYRAGAGLVEMAVPGSIQLAIAAHALEPIFCLLPESDGCLTPEAAHVVRERVAKATAVVFGCGMGQTDATTQLTRSMLDLLADTGKPAVVDADALNALSTLENWWKTRAQLILTPHPGEMARLTKLTIAEIERDRLGAARHWAARWGQIVVLKGAATIIATPDGDCIINQTGSGNLATAGTGDVLSGIIGGLLAQRCARREAAIAGVYLHGRAGDLLHSQQGDIGMIASDLHAMIPVARRSILSGIEVTE